MSRQETRGEDYVKISDIKIGKRFRKDVGDIENLVQSVSEIGLLHPIVITRHFDLIAGQRRLEACKKLGLEAVPAVYVDPADILKAQIQENQVRENLSFEETMEAADYLEPKVAELARIR